jgi:2-hydroxyacyl-CoA lyase 1
VVRAATLLASAKRPLIIVGKGAAYSRAEAELLLLARSQRLPVLPSPMAKGMIPDDHELLVSSARSAALKDADVILLVGARLNWMFEFGAAPKLSQDAHIIQIDVCAEQMGCNRASDVMLLGDARIVLAQLAETLAPHSPDLRHEWWQSLRKVCETNRRGLETLCMSPTQPMQYHFVLARINAALPEAALVVNEGANTMDVGRIVLSHSKPRCRLDAGTSGTMGIGVGYAIAASLVFGDDGKGRKVVTVQGDSAFGFSAMEVEVAVRYRLPITFIVLNNNGIYAGEECLDEAKRDPVSLSPSVLSPEMRYDKLMEACGGRGFFVEVPEDLDVVLATAMKATGPTLINIKIDPRSSPQPSSGKLEANGSPEPSPMTSEKLSAILH